MISTIIIFILILGLLIFVHELGHFVTAKKMGVRVDEFGFGFPPRMFGIRRGGTLYSLNWIPLGGFVKIKGETGESSNDADSFAGKKAWQKTSILSAGVVMNFVLAFVLFSIGFMVGMPQEITDADLKEKAIENIQIIIAEVEPNSPAEQADLKVGDTLVAINGEIFSDSDSIIKYISDNKESELSISMRRGNEERSINVQAQVYGDNEEPLVGIGMLRVGLVKHGFFKSIYEGFRATIIMIVLVVMALFGMIRDLFSGAGISNQISGPVGVAVLTGQVARLGISYIINFTAMLSINLGILNIFPFPALDGGRIIFVIIEKIKKSPVNPKVENIFHNIGFALLITLIVFVTYKDFARYGNDIVGGFFGLFS